MIYAIADQLPRSEEYNLKSQIVRAATSVALNIAEGSTGQTSVEQTRFLGLAIRSVLETVACQHIIKRRSYLQDLTILRRAYSDADRLTAKLQAMRNSLVPQQTWLREETLEYHNGDQPSDDE
jgi:four helix bundle protein